MKRRIAGALAIGLGLLSVGFLYAAFAPQPQVAQAQQDTALIAKGEQLYNNTCITCHGANLQGVQERGPSLIGVGDAAVYFQVSSGRMPMARQEAQAARKHPLPIFDPETQEGRANSRRWARSCRPTAAGRSPRPRPARPCAATTRAVVACCTG